MEVIRGPTDGSDPDFYAVFDAFWDYEVEHLSDNFCPPKVTVTEEEDTVINTANPISDPDHADGPTVTGDTIDLADYPFLRDAVSAVEPGLDSTEANPTTVFANNTIWWVRLNEPGTADDETSPLKLGFSTDLLDSDDWYNADGDPVQMQFAAVHVIRAGVPVEAHVVGANFFAFEERATDTPLDDPKWSNLETADHSEIGMQTEEYLPMQFAFTKPGVYLVQAQIQGHVRKEDSWGGNVPEGWEEISTGTTLTSPTEWYTFHVGPETDMGVEITHTDETSGDDTTTVTDGTASFSVTATNNGPDTAEGVVVEVSLPVGLDYVTDASHTGVTFECGIVSWKVGDLNSGASETLNFTADVGTGAAKTLTAGVEIHSSTVDDNEANDTASVDVKTNSTVVTAPVFPGVTRSIVEHALEGTHAGEPVAALNPDGRHLTYTLEGRCTSWFKAHNNGQIVLGADRTLDYDEQSEFHLTLQVSDGVNDDGTTDTDKSPDHWIPVTIQVIDGLDDVDHPTVSIHLTNPFPTDPNNANQRDLDLTGDPPLSLKADTVVNIVPTFTNPPEGEVTFHWDIITDGVSGEQRYISGPANSGTIRKGPENQTPATIEYKLHATWEGGGITTSYTIIWVAP